MTSHESRAPSGTEPTPRRSFMWRIALLVIGLVTSLWGWRWGVTVFFDPLLRKRQPPLRYRQASRRW